MQKNFLKKGFTLIEALIVLSILTIISFAAITSFSGLRSQAALEDGRATLVASLEQARSRSVSGVGTTAEQHGVEIRQTEIVPIKRNESGNIEYDLDKLIKLPAAISANETSTVIFDRLSGTSTGTSIIVKHANGTETEIIITDEGRIITD